MLHPGLATPRRSIGTHLRLPLLLTGFQQFHHLGNSRRARVRLARAIDPAQVSFAIKRCQRVKKRARPRFGLKRGGNISGKRLSLRAFRRQARFDRITGVKPVIPPPRRPKRQYADAILIDERAANRLSGNRTGNMMARFRTPDLIRVEWDWKINATAFLRKHRCKSLFGHDVASHFL